MSRVLCPIFYYSILNCSSKHYLTRYKAKYNLNPTLKIEKQRYYDREKEKTRNKYSLAALLSQNPENYKMSIPKLSSIFQLYNKIELLKFFVAVG